MFNKVCRQHALILLLSVSCALFASPASTAASEGIELLLTGFFHGNEISAETGERWTGLFRTDTGFEIAGTDVTVEIVEDAVLDEPGSKTGKRVTVGRDDEPLFMVKGDTGIKEGLVMTAFDGGEWLKRGRRVEMDLAGTVYTLAASGEGEDGLRMENYKIVLSRGGVSQEIAGMEFCCSDNMPALIWAGDIDGDGALDLFMGLSNHYNITRPALFLSSLAGEGELVGKAAELVTYGC